MKQAKGTPRRMTRRGALQVLGGGAASAVLAATASRRPAVAQAGRPKKPNVLFIAVDDLNCRLGCYGYPYMKTPSIDRLAKQGVRFDHAHCQFALCNPSRSSLLTGRRPDTTKVLNNSAKFRDALPDVVTLAQHFQQNGYWLARTGKIYHGGIEEPLGWDVMEDNPGVPPELRAKAKMVAEGGKLEPPAPPAGAPGRAQRAQAGGVPLVWRSMSGPDEAQGDGQIALKGLEFLKQRPKDKPFFIAVGFHKPHLPFVAPSKYFELYDPATIKVWSRPPGTPPSRWNEGVSDDVAQGLIAAYFACISFMDAQVGKLLDALDEAKLADDTLIVFWGDNGYHLTEHGRWRKSTLYEVSARVPLIVAAPGAKSGVACPRLVEFVDIYPSLAELCGLPAPAGVEATSFAPLMSDPQRAWKKAAFTRNSNGHTVRTDRWRYMELLDSSGQELYDEQNDPDELKNLATDPKAAETLKQLQEMLRKGWQAALP